MFSYTGHLDLEEDGRGGIYGYLYNWADDRHTNVTFTGHSGALWEELRPNLDTDPCATTVIRNFDLAGVLADYCEEHPEECSRPELLPWIIRWLRAVFQMRNQYADPVDY